MRKISRAVLTAALAVAAAWGALAQTTVSGPDGKLKVNISADAKYSVEYDGIQVLEPSALGFKANIGDFSALKFVKDTAYTVDQTYKIPTIKASEVNYKANVAVATFQNEAGLGFDVEFRVSDNDIAFRYVIPRPRTRGYAPGGIRIFEEVSAFKLPAGTVSFLTPQSDAMIGFARTKPSYEEFYYLEKPLEEKSEYGHGYTFPCLFKTAQGAWVLISETGVDSRYCASHLSDWDPVKGYTVAFPLPEENNGEGDAGAAFSVPGATPWRTITVGRDLAPIAETTVAWDVVEQLYEPSIDYKFGRSSWSWILWQDPSINWDDLVAYIDLSAAMGWEYTLVDAYWDRNLGYEKMEELIQYANSKNVDVFLWYSSSGWWNDIPQSPKDNLTTAVSRKKEMAWMKKAGVKGIKVDFFGGDKQQTMRYYEDILSDANDYGLMCIFHGATLPRGWEKMYPNFVGSEAVRASENMVFNQNDCNLEPEFACLHPFIRNTVASMEFGGTFLQRRLNRNPERGSRRMTTDVFQLGLAVVYQNPVQNFALSPTNLTDGTSEVCLDFMRKVPTTWDETRLIDGYPGKYVTMARRKGNTWYIVSLNGTLDKPMKVDLNAIYKKLGIDAGISQTVLYTGGNDASASTKVPAKAIDVAPADAIVAVVNSWINPAILGQGK
ncbi:MAG: glycoside hydrolase family 97 catalytic domain-containing protein [Bacteroidales bacterium]|nr:glycoside hydrolase family 97 catalytic domain-containing protein [Bacteroidales bacterium]